MATLDTKPGQIVDLQPLGAELKGATTTVLVKTDAFQTVRLIVHAGVEIPPHQRAGNVTMHCLEGHVRLTLAPTTVDLNANQWLYLDRGATHSVKAVDDSCLLLTILADR